MHPLLGRALNPELWKKDAEIFREGNCNFIRTSHYPPAEEFLDQCDRLGLFVELEAPLCWVGHGASDYFKGAPSGEAIFQRLAQANLETVQGYPNHPSVIMRSMANESAWSTLFARVHKAIRKADPTRPCTFHDQCWGGDNNGGSKQMPIAVIHYPGLDGPAMCAHESRPVHFGEYCHLESYNRRELATDPGLRDLWGQGLDLMWGKMRTAPGCFGGSIWSAIDDTFFLPERRDRRLRHLGADRRLAAAEAGVLAHEKGLFAAADSRHVRAASRGRATACGWKWKIGTTSPT